jgi:flagellar hook-associated protein 2
MPSTTTSISNSINSSGLASVIASGSLPNIGTSSNNGSLSSSLAVSGLASGMNWQSIVQQLATAERSPELIWQKQQTKLNAQNAAYNTINTNLTTLQADIQALQASSLYNTRAASTSNSAVAVATAASGATMGSFNFNITQLATSAQINGTASISKALSADGNLNNVMIGTAGFSSPVTAGTFTVNGAQITVASTDTLQTVFNNIASATNNAVTASYDPTSDKITLTSANSSQPVVLGSAADSSNFLQVSQLYNNNSGAVTSANALGHVNLTTNMSGSHLATTATDGGSGNGAFNVNGVTINYSSSNDSIQNVLDRINSSTAGVNASYDSLNNKFVLTNKITGDVGVAMNDVTGNFLAATGLPGGTLTHGKNLLYTLNGGQQLVSQSNTIDPTSSGINSLSVTAVTTGAVTASVTSDTSQVTAAVQKFITDYNAVQSYISGQAAVSTDSSGNITAGTLTADQGANEIASTLRSTAYGVVSGLSGSIKQLADLGIQTNGQDNTITLSDPSALASALSTNLNSVASFFSDPTKGLGTQLTTLINNTTGINGSVTNHLLSLTQQSNNITTQTSNLESTIAADSQRWTNEFIAMEQAQSQINQQMTYLSQQVANGTM